MAPPKVRRVVTGHDDAGRSIVAIDEVAQGERFTLLWTTDTSPPTTRTPSTVANAKSGSRSREGQSSESANWRLVRAHGCTEPIQSIMASSSRESWTWSLTAEKLST